MTLSNHFFLSRALGNNCTAQNLIIATIIIWEIFLFFIWSQGKMLCGICNQIGGILEPWAQYG
jgi:hypothetical protein